MMVPFTLLLLVNCLMLSPSASFMFDQQSLINDKRGRRTITASSTITTTTTQCWGKYGRNTPKRTRIDTDDILSYERTLITDRGYSYVLGSDESGRGSIAGPVVTASCCILTLSDNGEVIDPSHLPTVGLLPLPEGSSSNNCKLIQDSKQLSPEDRERVYEVIVNNPQVYAFSVAQRSNIEIDETNNILTSSMEAFQESIEDLAQNKLFPHIFSSQQNILLDGSNQIKNFDDNSTNSGKSSSDSDADVPIVIPDDWEDCGCYGIVDGKKAPKVSTAPSFPCRPMVKADQQVYTVALASIIAKVTLDRMTEEWHKLYPLYGFNENKGYATRDHIEAIHENGPCPLHRMTFKSLKGR
mmetsp:Transcript_19148/g.41583  ORF Transcript_19148/g.41583 Transcript_19148/m.41583 type:complete len:355 (-) Transcript_19148:340-1404(-)